MLYLLLGVAFATAAFPLRTIRWRYILRYEGATLPFVPLWHATAIGFMANNLLPARAGELARIYAAGKLTSVSYAASFASVAIERVFDGLLIVGLMVAALIAGGFTGEVTIAGVPLVQIVQTSTILLSVALAAAIIAVRWSTLTLRLSGKVLSALLPDSAARKIANVLQGILAGLDALQSPGRIGAILAWSFVVWISNGLGFWFAFEAFGLNLPLSAAFLLQGVIALGIAIPSTPGFFGPFEAAIRVTLALYAINAAQAVSYAVVFHLAGFIPITLLGLFSLSRAHLHLADLRAEPSHE